MKKKEVFFTNSYDKFGEVSQKLSTAGIEFTTKVSANDEASSPFFASLFTSSRRARGSFKEEGNLSKNYTIYVKIDDYDKAKALIG